MGVNIAEIFEGVEGAAVELLWGLRDTLLLPLSIEVRHVT